MTGQPTEDTEFHRSISTRGGSKRKSDQERRAATEQRHPKAAAMLRAGFTHHQVAQSCGISTATVSNIRRALGIPAPNGRTGPKHPRPGQTAEQRRLDDEIARLLTAGHANEQITHALHVGSERVSRVLHDRGIVLPAVRGKRSGAELGRLEEQALAMLKAGATYKAIYAETRLSPNVIAALRKRHAVPVPERAPAPHARKRARTVADVLTLHTEPYGDGHARWTGARSGHQDIVFAEGRRMSARRCAFRAHHQREPVGYLKNSCDETDCIAGPHLTDDVIRDAHTRADHAFERIFGATA